jgi:amino acid transporter
MDTREPTNVETDRDTADLARFGYKQELKRSLRFFSSFAVAFSYISPSTGIFTLFWLGLGTIGGVFFWTWPIVALGQFIIALNFAEVSSHFPLAGSVFQWTKYLSTRTHAWFNGWIYLFAGVITVTAVVVTLPIALIPFLNGIGWHIANTTANNIAIAAITLALITLLNIYGVRIVAIVNNTGVVFEILGMVIFAVFLAALHNHQGPGVIFKTGGQSLTFSTFMVAMFMSLFVIYGFDTASTLAEETKDPKREAPKAVLSSVAGAFVIGAIFLWGTLMAIPDLKATIAKSATDPYGVLPGIIEANFSKAFATTYLFVVSAAIFVCCLAIMTSTIRLCFGMARDNQLPFSRSLAKVNPRLHTPIWSCLAIGALAGIPMIQFAGAGYIAIAATGMIYFSYVIGNVAIMRARLKGWPKTIAPFKLGKWGPVVNVLGLAWGIGMLVNFAIPRACCNPKPNQTAGLLHIGPLNGVPILWTVAAVVIVLGFLYWALVQRHKSFSPLVPPDEEVLPAAAGT